MFFNTVNILCHHLVSANKSCQFTISLSQNLFAMVAQVQATPIIFCGIMLLRPATKHQIESTMIRECIKVLFTSRG